MITCTLRVFNSKQGRRRSISSVSPILASRPGQDRGNHKGSTYVEDASVLQVLWIVMLFKAKVIDSRVTVSLHQSS